MNLNELLKLSVSERISLIEKIWDSIPSDEIDLSEAQKNELDKRIERLKTGKTKFYSWKEIKSNLTIAKK